MPDRREIIWIDCSPQSGREMKDRYPFFVLSPRDFNDRTSLVIGLPMTTAEYNSDNPFAIAAGIASGRKAGKTSFILCHQPKSFDWRARQAAPHPMKTVSDAAFGQVCAILNQIIQVA